MFFWLLLWQLAAVIVNKQIILVSPLAAAKRLLELGTKPDFWQTVLRSSARIWTGFLLGFFGGILLGAAAFSSKLAETMISPLMSAVRSVPVASFVILALLWLKSGQLTIFISMLIVLPVVYSNVLEGLGSADKKLLEEARILKMSRLRTVRYVYLPALMPCLTAAAETAAGLCWKSGAAAEVIAQPAGSIGDMLYRAKIYLETADLFAWTAVIIILSQLTVRIVVFGIKRLYRLSQKVNEN